MATPEQRQQVHRAVLDRFVETGRAPHFTELATATGWDISEARRALHETTTESPFSFAWVTPDTDVVGAWAPFSNAPTNNVISVDGIEKWYGQ